MGSFEDQQVAIIRKQRPEQCWPFVNVWLFTFRRDKAKMKYDLSKATLGKFKTGTGSVSREKEGEVRPQEKLMKNYLEYFSSSLISDVVPVSKDAGLRLASLTHNSPKKTGVMRRVCDSPDVHNTTQMHDQCLCQMTHTHDLVSNNSLRSLQLIQNAAARVLTGIDKRDHITPVLASLHWLPVKFRIIFKTLLLTYKVLRGLVPSYLEELVIPYQPNRPLRSQNAGLLVVPRVSRSRMGTEHLATSPPAVEPAPCPGTGG
ncbi:hypothetical protein D4764_07G0001860 [Takifugu flavidus]|uniref:Uncharacterized protein n=1 Tax=Takifugu flavidus TaxID=433684 RepID=A0A5C6MVQ6_9TELE|nr:hypothetical protein D4764_07G0001860 [Takifugu flavidus]